MTSRAQILLLAAFLLTASPVWPESDPATVPVGLERPPASEGDDAGSAREAEAETRTPRSIVYVPPARGSVRASAGGGIRGGGMVLPRPVVLAPPHVALTEQEAPSLFWYVDRAPPAETRVSFVLIRADRIDPVAERALTGASSAGTQRIRLSDLGIELEPGVEYEWSVALVADSNNRARDLVSTGWLRRVDEAVSADGARDARAYAQRSLWYDALEAISDELDANPGDPTLRAQRDDLLRQAGLP